MRAIVLVGGEGTRLRPLTWRTAKALVPVLNRPLLDHLLLHLKRHGVTHATLAMTKRNAAIRDAFGDGSRLGIAVDYAYEDTPLGSGGAIAGIASGWNETFLVCNGDIITDLDISAMVDNHRRTGAVLSLSLHEVDDPSPYGVVDIGADGFINRFVEKPRREDAPSLLINAGTWLFEPELVTMLDPATFNRVEDTIFPTLCAEGRPVQGFHRPAYWADVGNPAALLRVNLDMAASQSAGALVDPGADVHPDADIRDAVIGPGSRIAAGASVRGSVLWDGVHVAEGAQIEGSILASDVSIGAAAIVRNSIIAHGAQVAPGDTLDGASVEPSETWTDSETAATR